MMTFPINFWENAKFMATSHHQPVIVCLGKSSFSIAKSSHHSWAMFNRFLLSHWRVKTNIPGLGISLTNAGWLMVAGLLQAETSRIRAFSLSNMDI